MSSLWRTGDECRGVSLDNRYDNNGNSENAQTRLHGTIENPNYNNLPQTYTSNTGQRNYSHNEYAQVMSRTSSIFFHLRRFTSRSPGG